jgi:type II secretory ATPase GspE/PulE/Tfp pilus assembly ATPase PilB-like protein
MAGMGRAVVSVEGPVERYLPGVTQVPASAETFAVMVAHARRQEARALAVGGTPDRPTAKEACEAALDCLVVLAVRGEDAASGLRALVDLGLDPCALGASLLGALGQRLLRLNCPECSRPIEVPAPTQSALRRLGPLPAGEPTFKAGGRCFACGHSGYAKAQGLFELALATPALQAALASEATERELRAVAVQDGMQPLGEQILARVWRGLTSPVEALRVGRVERFVAGPS